MPAPITVVLLITAAILAGPALGAALVLCVLALFFEIALSLQ